MSLPRFEEQAEPLSPEEKIDAWTPRFGRERPVIALLGHKSSAELADYMTPHGVLAQADAADVFSVSTGAALISTRPLKVEAELNTEQFDQRYVDSADYVIVPAIFEGPDYPEFSKHNSDAFEARPGEMGSGEPAMTLGIPLSEGMDEISLGLTADAYMHSQQVVFRALASALEPVTTLSFDALTDRIQRVLSYAREHLREPLRVEHLAAVAHLSVRQFSRAFRAATATTPESDRTHARGEREASGRTWA